ncbi:MAG: hypothetical protein IIA48_11505 [Bacteroidetes bacterium]|nr:hypothetical protein [Bacteroidota bacterium]
MGVRIDKIVAKNLGPLTDFSEEFGQFNLIYSQNEKGKTFLTEFIIRCLFRNTKRWKLREGGRGNVWVSGLEDQPIAFTPSKKPKLEDWMEGKGLPSALVNLVVAKGAEAEIANVPGGLDKHIVREILSEKKILDNIEANISKTVQEAILENGTIDISIRGEGKKYQDLNNEIKDITNLIIKIGTEYSLGELERLKIQKKKDEEKFKTQQKAKYHKANIIAQYIETIEKNLSKLDEREISNISIKKENLEKIRKKLAHKEKEFKQAEQDSQTFQWLKSLIDNYRSLTTKTIEKPNRVFPYLSVLFFLGGGLSLFWWDKVIALVLFAVAFGIFRFYFDIYYRATKNFGEHSELKKLKEEFAERIGLEIKNTATIQSEFEKYQKAPGEEANLKKEISDLKDEFNDLVVSIEQGFSKLTENKIDESNWNVELTKLDQQVKDLKESKKTEQEKLMELKVDESDYLKEKIDVEYSKQTYEHLNEEIKKINKGIEEKEVELITIKHKICSITVDDFSISFEKAFENLQIKRIEKEEELKTIKSEIVAGNTVYKILDNLHKKEDVKIAEGLASENITILLQALTKRYKLISLDDEYLKVSDDIQDFYLKDLSTGAQEQIMLALRIGFSSQLLKKESMFLILDDAFQHSDWQKREVLINKLADVAKNGWQIIYFTMDDHIRDCFDKIGSSKLNNDYKKICL